MSVNMNITGLDDLIRDVNRCVNAYPDECGAELRKLAVSIKKDSIKETRAAVNVNPKDKYTLVKNYGVSRLQGYGHNQYVEIYTTSPHMGLIEKGHEMVAPVTKEHKGTVAGYNILGAVVDEYDKDMPKHMRNIIDTVFRRHNLWLQQKI